MHFTEWISQYAFHSTRFAVCISHCTFHAMHFILCISQYAFHTTQSTQSTQSSQCTQSTQSTHYTFYTNQSTPALRPCGAMSLQPLRMPPDRLCPDATTTGAKEGRRMYMPLDVIVDVICNL